MMNTLQKTQLDQEVQKSGMKLDHLRKENAELRAKVEACEEENTNLEKGMREIQSAIQEQGEININASFGFVSLSGTLLIQLSTPFWAVFAKAT